MEEFFMAWALVLIIVGIIWVICTGLIYLSSFLPNWVLVSGFILLITGIFALVIVNTVR